MTIKSATTNEYRIASLTTSDTFGGQQLHCNFTLEMVELFNWWQEWRPVFQSKDPTVIDLLKQARTLHEITK
jgi:hypothetical protein